MIPFGQHWVEQILESVDCNVRIGLWEQMRKLQRELHLTRLSALGIMRDALKEVIEDEIKEQDEEFGKVTP